MQGEKQASFTQFSFICCAFLRCGFSFDILRFSAVLFGRLFTGTKATCSDSTRGECYGKQRKNLFFTPKRFMAPLRKLPRAKRKTFLILLPILRRGGRGER